MNVTTQIACSMQRRREKLEAVREALADHRHSERRQLEGRFAALEISAARVAAEIEERANGDKIPSRTALRRLRDRAQQIRAMTRCCTSQAQPLGMAAPNSLTAITDYAFSLVDGQFRRERAAADAAAEDSATTR